MLENLASEAIKATVESPKTNSFELSKNGLENIQKNSLHSDISNISDFNIEKPECNQLDRTEEQILNPSDVLELPIIEMPFDNPEALSKFELFEIQLEHPDWTSNILDNFYSMEQYRIFDEADLAYKKVDGIDCLIKQDIDLDFIDEDGMSNADRMSEGLAPIGEDGHPLELHHIGQKDSSPLAELTKSEHRGAGNMGILHDMNKPSEINRVAFDIIRNNHWIDRQPI